MATDADATTFSVPDDFDKPEEKTYRIHRSRGDVMNTEHYTEAGRAACELVGPTRTATSSICTWRAPRRRAAAAVAAVESSAGGVGLPENSIL